MNLFSILMFLMGYFFLVWPVEEFDLWGVLLLFLCRRSSLWEGRILILRGCFGVINEIWKYSRRFCISNLLKQKISFVQLFYLGL